MTGLGRTLHDVPELFGGHRGRCYLRAISVATIDSILGLGMARGYGCASKRTPPGPSRPG
jgi:hypothetical protein